MREARHVVEKNGRFLVAVPAAVRQHLGLVKGATVYWHVTTKGAAAFTASGRARGGRPRLDADCSSCATYRAELERTRNLLRGAHTGDFNSAFTQGYEQGVKAVPIWRNEVKWLREDLNDVRALVAQLVVRLPERKTPRRRGGNAPRAVDAIALPDLPSSPSSVVGEAVAPGAEPTGHPTAT